MTLFNDSIFAELKIYGLIFLRRYGYITAVPAEVAEQNRNTYDGCKSAVKKAIVKSNVSNTIAAAAVTRNFAVAKFRVGNFAEGNFAVRKFRRIEILP